MSELSIRGKSVRLVFIVVDLCSGSVFRLGF